MKHPLYNQVAKYITGQLTLPEAKPGQKQFFLVPVSSGIDSTAVAIVLKILFPDLPFTYVFTDTGNEIAGTEEALDRLEAVLGVKIIRIRPKVSLLDKVEAQGNYLPSPRQRYCTQIGKIAPFKQFMAALKQMHGEGTQFISFVGVRADEPEREGVQWADENALTVFPLQQLGFDKAAVNKLVQEVTGIPIYYANKSRSGCALCINSRRSEVINMIETDSGTFEQAVRTETMPEQYGNLLKFLPKSVCLMTGVGRNWLQLAKPEEMGGAGMAWTGERGKTGARKSMTLFGSASQIYYVAVEHHKAGHGDIHYQKFITFSGSLGGVVTALKHHTMHRYQTKELWGHQSEAGLSGEQHIAIYEVEIEDAQLHIPQKPEGVYSWQSDGKTLLEIRKVKFLIEQILLTEGLRQDSKSNDQALQVEAKALLSKIDIEYGRILNARMYDRPALSCLIEDMDITDAPAMCNACSR